MNAGRSESGRRIFTPLSEEVVRSLQAGERVLLNGVVYAARDAAHRKMSETLARGGELPVDLRGQVIYYVGPTPAPPGRALGSAGPTTSGRMDPYTPPLLRQGLKGMIGKGPRGPQVRRAMQELGAVYFVVTGGAGALLSRHVVSARIVAYPELGTEALRELVVRDLPALVAVDAHGADLFTSGRLVFQQPSGEIAVS